MGIADQADNPSSALSRFLAEHLPRLNTRHSSRRPSTSRSSDSFSVFGTWPWPGRPAQLRPARRLLIFASAVTFALNVADPLIAGEYGKAAFDAVGPLLLIGWG